MTTDNLVICSIVNDKCPDHCAHKEYHKPIETDDFGESCFTCNETGYCSTIGIDCCCRERFKG